MTSLELKRIVRRATSLEEIKDIVKKRTKEQPPLMMEVGEKVERIYRAIQRFHRSHHDHLVDLISPFISDEEAKELKQIKMDRTFRDTFMTMFVTADDVPVLLTDEVDKCAYTAGLKQLDVERKIKRLATEEEINKFFCAMTVCWNEERALGAFHIGGVTIDVFEP